MNIETLVLLGVAYVIGFYVMTFIQGMFGKTLNISVDWTVCILWPIFISALIVVWLVAGLLIGLSKLYELTFSKIGSRFPAMARFAKGH